MNIIQKLTEGCTGDCTINQGPSVSTCIGYTPSFDRYGNSKTLNPNITTTNYSCSFCGLAWTVKSRQGKPDEIIPQDNR